MIFIWLALLAVFSSLSVNLILQFGIGLSRITMNGKLQSGPASGKKKLYGGLGIIFVTVILLWFIFSFLGSVISLGLLEYVLVFPAGFIVFSGISYFIKIKKDKNNKNDIKDDDDDKITGGIFSSAALFICINIAGKFLDTVILTLGFIAGIWLAVKITSEIQKRSEMEAVPKCLKDGPLVLVSMGILSLVFTSAALMLYQVLGAR